MGEKIAITITCGVFYNYAIYAITKFYNYAITKTCGVFYNLFLFDDSCNIKNRY